MTETPPTLTYGKTPRRTRRWWWVGMLAGLVVVGIVGWQKGWLGTAKSMWAHYRASAPVRRAMLYTFPQGKVLWDPGARPAVNVPPPQEWESIYIGWGLPEDKTTLFVHGRTTQSGAKWLVVIALEPPGLGHGQHLSAMMMEAGTLTDWPRHHGLYTVLDLQELPVTPVRFYAGQVDPADASHFTIDFDAADGRHTVDGWLRDDTRLARDPVSVKMELRPAEAKGR